MYNVIITKIAHTRSTRSAKNSLKCPLAASAWTR